MKNTIIQVQNLNFSYGKTQVLFDINIELLSHTVTALIGPSGCGKTTFLRCLNRMNELVDNTHTNGSIIFRDENILSKKVDVISLRRKIGMVFQRSNPFPKSIFENVIYGLRIIGIKEKRKLQEICEESLKKTALWDEVKDRLHESAFTLSGGQMQRLCIARSLAIQPDIILMDEPCSALDPKSTTRIEALITELKKNYTIIIVTHNMQQASRISEKTIFFLNGKLIEYNDTKAIFTFPAHKETEDYITGRFG